MPLFWQLHEEPRDFYRYTSHGLRHLFLAADFELVEIHPMSGFLTTFATAANYYLTRFRRPPIEWISRALIALNNLAMVQAWLCSSIEGSRAQSLSKSCS